MSHYSYNGRSDYTCEPEESDSLGSKMSTLLIEMTESIFFKR